jgi:acetyl esterase/lipase
MSPRLSGRQSLASHEGALGTITRYLHSALMKFAVTTAILLLPVLPSVAASPAITITHDVAYGALPQQKLDIYEPSSGTTNGAILVFFHGGGFRTGSKSYLRAIGESFAASGFIFVAPEYRLYPEAVFPQFVEDSALAVSYVWRRFRTAEGRPRPLFVAGHSAGAYNAAMVALDQRFLAAVGIPPGAITGLIGIAGAYEPVRWGNSGLEDIFPEAERGRSAPVSFLEEEDPPMLLIAGEADREVSMRHIEGLTEAARRAGVSVTASVYPGFDHMGLYFALMDTNGGIRQDIATFTARVSAARQ